MGSADQIDDDVEALKTLVSPRLQDGQALPNLVGWLVRGASRRKIATRKWLMSFTYGQIAEAVAWLASETGETEEVIRRLFKGIWTRPPRDSAGAKNHRRIDIPQNVVDDLRAKFARMRAAMRWWAIAANGLEEAEERLREARHKERDVKYGLRQLKLADPKAIKHPKGPTIH